jgi:hypothetical protein
MGTVIKESNLLNTDLLQCMDMTLWHRNRFLYQYMGVDGQMVSMPPHTDLFDRNTEKWVIHEVQQQEEPQEQEAPQHPWSAPPTYGRGAGGWGDHHPGY